jgi:hypothetical protein
VVIGLDVDDAAAQVVAESRITQRLRPGAGAADVLWELSLLFPEAMVQRLLVNGERNVAVL